MSSGSRGAIGKSLSDSSLSVAGRMTRGDVAVRGCGHASSSRKSIQTSSSSLRFGTSVRWCNLSGRCSRGSLSRVARTRPSHRLPALVTHGNRVVGERARQNRLWYPAWSSLRVGIDAQTVEVGAVNVVKRNGEASLNLHGRRCRGPCGFNQVEDGLGRDEPRILGQRGQPSLDIVPPVPERFLGGDLKMLEFRGLGRQPVGRREGWRNSAVATPRTPSNPGTSRMPRSRLPAPLSIAPIIETSALRSSRCSYPIPSRQDIR